MTGIFFVRNFLLCGSMNTKVLRKTIIKNEIRRDIMNLDAKTYQKYANAYAKK